MKTSHFSIGVQHVRRLAALCASLAVSVSAGRVAAHTRDDIQFGIAPSSGGHLKINGSAVSVSVVGGRVGIATDDAPCVFGADGEQICGYTVNYVRLYLSDFSAGGHSFVSSVLTTTQPVHLFSNNGQLTIPSGTAGDFGATVDGTRQFTNQTMPANLSLNLNLATQQATVSLGFQGTFDGASVDVAISASAVSPFTMVPPAVNAGPDMTVHGHGALVQVPLSGTATGVGRSIVGAEWLENGAVVAEGLSTTTVLAPGTHTLMLEAVDSLGAHGTDTVVIQVAPGMTIGPAGNRLEYFYCGQEGDTCALTGKKYVAYGANGQFIFRAVTGSIPCSINFFGVDPIVGVVKSCYFANYGLTVGENGTGAAPSSGVDVAYGANGVFTFGHFAGSYSCSNATFGDPIPGVVKACYNALPGYNGVAVDFGTMTGLNNTWTAYGAHGTFIYKVLSGTVPCLPSTFGYDPVVGVQKTCYTMFVGTPIASENQSASWNGPVIYGSGLDGNYLTATTTGALSCSNAAFGGDPHVFVAKTCYGESIVP